MAVNKEVWKKGIKEQYEVNVPQFLKECTPLETVMVDGNEYMHSSEAGADPDVLEDNNTYPIPTVERTDVSQKTRMVKFETKNTIVRDLENMQYHYDKKLSVTKGHARALANKHSLHAAYVFSPTSDTTDTPILVTTGLDDGRSTGSKALLEADILNLHEAMYAIVGDTPKNLVLSVQHFFDIQRTSEILQRQQYSIGKMGEISIAPVYLHGFKIFVYNSGVLYDSSGNKLAKGTNKTPTRRPASFCFVGDEAEYGIGTVRPFFKIADPDQRGDVVGFGRWFGARTARQSEKFFGAIRSVAV